MGNKNSQPYAHIWSRATPLATTCLLCGEPLIPTPAPEHWEKTDWVAEHVGEQCSAFQTEATETFPTTRPSRARHRDASVDDLQAQIERLSVALSDAGMPMYKVEAIRKGQS